MSNLEVITSKNVDRIEIIGDELANVYKVAFAGEPWYEASKCIDSGCSVKFSAKTPGCTCELCGSTLTEAYVSDELIANWQAMLENDDALFEVAFEDSLAQRVTIARPTNRTELMSRKYDDVPAMKQWLETRFGDEFVWIEDTFANRSRKETGNLATRGETLSRIAAYYAGLPILTRTLSTAIVASTLRDVGEASMAYIGSEGVGRSVVNQIFDNPGYELPTVPDRRTLIAIGNTIRKSR